MAKTRPETLCLSCDMEVFKKCEYVHNLRPVNGWKVRHIKINIGGGKRTDGVLVLSCPDYKKEKKRPRRPLQEAEDTPTRYCTVCKKELSGKHRKYCSMKCLNADAYRRRGMEKH